MDKAQIIEGSNCNHVDMQHYNPANRTSYCCRRQAYLHSASN